MMLAMAVLGNEFLQPPFLEAAIPAVNDRKSLPARKPPIPRILHLKAEEPGALTSRSPQRVFDAILKEAKVPLPPRGGIGTQGEGFGTGTLYTPSKFSVSRGLAVRRCWQSESKMT